MHASKRLRQPDSPFLSYRAPGWDIMTGKPWIVAVLAGMVVAMIGTVFLQQAPEGFVVSSLLRVDEDAEARLEAELREEAQRELAKEGGPSVDPDSIRVLRTADSGEGPGVDVAVQAQGRNSRSAIDYLNELMVRYTRREGQVDEIAKVKLEIEQAERRLGDAAGQGRVTGEQIEANQREIHQLLERERLEAERLAAVQRAPEPPPAPSPIEAPQPAPPSFSPALSSPKLAAPQPAPEAEPEAESPSMETEPTDREPLSDDERLEIVDAIKLLKTERLKLINGGRRPAHPDVQNVDRQIRELEERLQNAGGETGFRKVQFEAPIRSERPRAATSAALSTLKQLRTKLEAEVKTLQVKQRQAARVAAQQKEILATLIPRHDALTAGFKPVVLAPAKVVSQIEAPLPWSRLWGTICGSLLAAVMGYFFAWWGRERRVLTSVAEAEEVLRMPVQKLEQPRRRRAA